MVKRVLRALAVPRAPVEVELEEVVAGAAQAAPGQHGASAVLRQAHHGFNGESTFPPWVSQQMLGLK